MLPRMTQSTQRSAEQGFTLIESLVAIVLIATVIAAMGPPILMAVATRLQNQRVEQATELARGEIDRIRLLVERGQNQNTNLPLVSTQSPIQSTLALASGTNGYTLTRANVTITKGLAIDINGDNVPDFVIQTFRDEGQSDPVNSTSIIAFWMGVRVYSFRSFTNNTNLTLQTVPLTLGFTTGENLRRPMAVFYTPIVRADRDFSLCGYQRLALNNPTATCSTN